MKVFAAVTICLTAVGCSKETESTPEEQFKDNFLALVMGGKEVDTQQDWSTSSGLSVKISVDYGNSMEYRVLSFLHPLSTMLRQPILAWPV